MKLSEEEKIFIACFVENAHLIFKPKYKNFISLYSYLDFTNESPRQQTVQIKRDDPYFVELLRTFSDRKMSTKKRNEAVIEVYDELEAGGFFDNKIFKERFDCVAKWLSSNRSNYFLNKMSNYRLDHFAMKRRAASAKREKDEKELIHQNYMKNKEIFDKNYNEAMLKLAKNQFKKPTTAVVNKRSVIEQWGRQKFIKDEDFGTWWREQE